MKAIILAAGMGTRLGKYTSNLPKAMLKFNGRPLIEWQIMQLRKAGYNDIIIVTGYKKEKFKFSNVKYYHNSEYASTNMIESLLCAKEELVGEVLVCYGDIIYTQDILNDISNFNGEIGVSADNNWKKYWKLRYGQIDFDLETFTVKNGIITDLGKEILSSKGVDYRYIGLIKFSCEGINKALNIYNTKKEEKSCWSQSGKIFKQGYMTDLLNELIIQDSIVKPIISRGGWIEFDTEKDYEVMQNQLNKGTLSSKFFN